MFLNARSMVQAYSRSKFMTNFYGQFDTKISKTKFPRITLGFNFASVTFTFYKKICSGQELFTDISFS